MLYWAHNCHRSISYPGDLTMSEVRQYLGKITTIDRFILEEQATYPDATGALTNLLYDMALAAKIIASRTTQAALADVLGSAGHENVQGEEVQKLDQFAQRTIFKLNDHTGRLAVMASEEEEDIIPIPALQVGEVRAALRPAGRLVEHRLQRQRGHHLRHLPAQDGRGAGHAGRRPAEGARPGRRRLHPLRHEHDARLLHRHGRARLHAGPLHRRVPALAPEHPHPESSPNTTAPTRAISPNLDAGGAGLHGMAAKRHTGEESTLACVISARWWRTSTATC